MNESSCSIVAIAGIAASKRTVLRPLARFQTLAAILIAMGFMVACGGGSSGSGSGQSYQGPGSYWNVSLDPDGTFVVTVAADPSTPVTLTVNGTYLRHPTGFIEMTVTTATGTNAPIAGDQAIALEIPGFAFLLKPLDGSGEIIPMLVAGECPTGDINANWFITTCNELGLPCDASEVTGDFLGEFLYDSTTQSASLPASYSLATGASLGAAALGQATCIDGLMDVSGTRMFLTAVGGAVVQISPGDYDEAKYALGLPKENLTSADLAGGYAGLVFDKTDDSVFSVNVDVATGGASATVYSVDESNLDSAANGSPVASITFTAVNQVATTAVDGWLTATFDNGVDPAQPMYCMAATDIVGSGRNMIACVGQSPSNPMRHYNAVMVSKN